MNEQPVIRWISETRTIEASLPTGDGKVFEARWNLSASSVVRIREKGSDKWSPGFETPFNSFRFVGLKPGTTYEFSVSHMNDAGEGPAAYSESTTLADGSVEGPIPNDN